MVYDTIMINEFSNLLRHRSILQDILSPGESSLVRFCFTTFKRFTSDFNIKCITDNGTHITVIVMSIAPLKFRLFHCVSLWTVIDIEQLSILSCVVDSLEKMRPGLPPG